MITLMSLLFLFALSCYSQSAYSYPKQIAPYIAPYDTDMLYEVAKEKQARYDYNLNLVVNKVEELRDVFAYINKTNGGFTKSQREIVALINKYLDNFNGDLSNSTVTRSLLSFLNECIRVVESWEEE